jgi:hypothetical protein
VQSPWRNLEGPTRLLADCATVLLISSTLLGLEAGIMIVLGDARDVVIKPFILLGYLEICGMFFSTIGIVCAILGLVFFRPYVFLGEQFRMLRARRAPQVTYTFENVPSPLHAFNPDEDGVPD